MLFLFLSAFLARGGEPAATAGLSAGVIGGVPYLVYVPRDYTPSRRWPLVLFPHGQGRAARTAGASSSRVCRRRCSRPPGAGRPSS